MSWSTHQWGQVVSTSAVLGRYSDFFDLRCEPWWRPHCQSECDGVWLVQLRRT